MSKANGHQDPQVTSLEDARKRAAQRAKAEREAARPGGPRSTRDWLIGGIIIAMAIGYIASLLMGAVPPATGVPK